MADKRVIVVLHKSMRVVGNELVISINSELNDDWIKKLPSGESEKKLLKFRTFRSKEQPAN